MSVFGAYMGGKKRREQDDMMNMLSQYGQQSSPLSGEGNL